jgi:RNA polymerase sigma factor (sigma-70 family)
VILPELGESLGRYAQKVLAQKRVEICLNTRVTSMTEKEVCLKNGPPIPSSTLIWTAGTMPNPWLSSLPCQKECGRVLVNEALQIPDWPGVWAVGANADNINLWPADAGTVRRAIAELPVEFRETIVLREMEGLSYKEIAALSDVPIGTVMSRLARARKQLQQRVAGEQRGPRDFRENDSAIQCGAREPDTNRKALT